MARIAVLVVAALAAGGAALLVRTLMADNNAASASAPSQIMQMPTTEVLVAAIPLDRGDTVTAGSLRWQPWPEDALSANYVTKAVHPNAEVETVDATFRVALEAGEPVSFNKIITLDNTGFMAAVLQPGMRAISTRISPETGAGGFILPNDRVDVILTEERRGETGTNVFARTILRNVRVLAIDQTFTENENDQTVIGKTATLELTPRQAEVLALSKAAGEVSLSLRSLADSGPNASEVADAGNQETSDIRIIRYGTGAYVDTGSAR